MVETIVSVITPVLLTLTAFYIIHQVTAIVFMNKAVRFYGAAHRAAQAASEEAHNRLDDVNRVSAVEVAAADRRYQEALANLAKLTAKHVVPKNESIFQAAQLHDALETYS